MIGRRLRALMLGALATMLLLAAATPASAFWYGPPELTWTLGDDGTARFDACGSNDGVVSRILEYTWVIFPAHSSVRIYEETLQGHGAPGTPCDDFSYRFTEEGTYRVVLDILNDAGERAYTDGYLEVDFPEADLGVTVTDSADPVLTGRSVTYTIELANAGPDAATDVELTAIVSPPGGADWSISGSGGMSCGQGSGVHCTEPTLGAGETRTVTVRASLGEPGTLATSAHARSATADPDDTNDDAIERTTVRAPDDVPPTVVGVPDRDPNAHGWYKRDVTIDWRASDPEPSSGDPSDPPDTVASKEGRDVEYESDPSCDPDDNCATGTVVLSIDATDPEVTCDFRDPVFLLRAADATISATVTDGLSGPVDAALIAAVDTTRVGAGAVELTGRDRAGNRTDVTCAYTVAYAFEGFFPPVRGDGVLNVVKAGWPIPLWWRLTDANGAPVRDLEDAEVTVRSLECPLGTSVDLAIEDSLGRTGLRHLGRGFYQLLWKTPKAYARSCKTMRLDLGDGTLHTALFRFTR